MYVYEGEDYSKCSDEDKKSFDQLLAGIIICLSFRCTISIFFTLGWERGGTHPVRVLIQCISGFQWLILCVFVSCRATEIVRE